MEQDYNPISPNDRVLKTGQPDLPARQDSKNPADYVHISHHRVQERQEHFARPFATPQTFTIVALHRQLYETY